MIKKSIKDARTNLTECIEKAKYGETIVITKSGKPQAKIVGLTEEELKNLEKKDELV